MSERQAKDMLKALVERIERLEEEKKSLADDVRDVYAEAKANGFDTKALRAIIRLRKLDADDRNEQRHILETYMGALGMLSDLDVPPGGIEAALDRRRSDRGKAHAERTQACTAHADVLRSPQFDFGAADDRAPSRGGVGPTVTLAFGGAETNSRGGGGQHRPAVHNVRRAAAAPRERSEAGVAPSPRETSEASTIGSPRTEALTRCPARVEESRVSTSPAHARANGTPLAASGQRLPPDDRAQIAGERPRPGNDRPRDLGGVELSDDDDAHGIPAFLRRALWIEGHPP